MTTLQKSVKLRQEEVVGFGQEIEFQVVRKKMPLNFPVWLSEKALLCVHYARVKVMSF